MNTIKPGLNGFCGSFPTSFPVKELILLGLRPCLLSSMSISKTPAQGRWNSGRGRQGEGSKRVKAMETYEK